MDGYRQFDAPAAQPAIRAIFDPESLLIDPTPGIRHSLRATLRDLGVPLSERWFRSCWSPRMPFDETLRQLLGDDDPERLHAGYHHYHHHYCTDGRFRGNLRPGAMQLYSDVVRGGVEMTYLTHIGAESAGRLLDTYGLRHLPRTVVSPERAQCPGIRLALIEHLVTEHGHPPGDWVLISDHPWELMFAKRLQLRTVGLGYGRLPTQMMLALQPDAIAAAPEEVPSLLASAARQSVGLLGAAALH